MNTLLPSIIDTLTFFHGMIFVPLKSLNLNKKIIYCKMIQERVNSYIQKGLTLLNKENVTYIYEDYRTFSISIEKMICILKKCQMKKADLSCQTR